MLDLTVDMTPQVWDDFAHSRFTDLLRPTRSHKEDWVLFVGMRNSITGICWFNLGLTLNIDLNAEVRAYARLDETS